MEKNKIKINKLKKAALNHKKVNLEFLTTFLIRKNKNGIFATLVLFD